MKRFLMTGVILGCLLMGSFYPRMMMEHHTILMDETGKEISWEGNRSKEIPLEFHFRFLQMFR